MNLNQKKKTDFMSEKTATEPKLSYKESSKPNVMPLWLGLLIFFGGIFGLCAVSGIHLMTGNLYILLGAISVGILFKGAFLIVNSLTLD